MFQENLGLEGACNLSELLNKVHPYINYEEELLGEEGEAKEQGDLDIDEHQKEITIVIENTGNANPDPGLTLTFSKTLQRRKSKKSV